MFERYYAVLVRFFANKVGGDPMDLIQETFLGCISGRSRIRDPTKFRSFLFSVAYNHLKKYYGQQAQARPFDPDTHTAADLSPGPGTMLAKSAEQRLLLHALRRLSVRHQVVLELFYWEGMTSAEIADVLDQPDGTIKTACVGARVLLKRALGDVTDDRQLHETTLNGLEDWAAKIRAAPWVQPRTHVIDSYTPSSSSMMRMSRSSPGGRAHVIGVGSIAELANIVVPPGTKLAIIEHHEGRPCRRSRENGGCLGAPRSIGGATLGTSSSPMATVFP